MNDELDDVYEISTDRNSSWWISKAEYERIKKLMSTAQQNSVLVITTLSGGEAVLFLHRVECISLSTKEQRDFNHEINKLYASERKARFDSDGWQDD